MDANSKTTKRIGDKTMTREQAKELLPIIQAYAEGKTIGYSYDGEHWERNDAPVWDCDVMFRIKPQPKYRPFKSQEECWNEMLKHQPFSFVVSKDSIDYSGICRVFKDEKGISRITFTSNPYSDWDMAKVFDTFQFADGTPFGIKEKKQ